MSITRYDPNTIFLGGERTQVGDLAASEVILPGMLIERFNNAGVIRFRKHTGAGLAGSTYACDHPMANKGVDDAYAANDLVEAGIGRGGSTFWAIIPSGANIAAGDKLSSNGDGRLKAVNGVAIAIAIENRNNTTGSLTPTTLPTGMTAGDARIRIEVL